MGREGEVRQIGNQKTFNIEDILAKNLLASEYLKSLVDKTFDELVDEIYERVKDTDPWLVRALSPPWLRARHILSRLFWSRCLVLTACARTCFFFC